MRSETRIWLLRPNAAASTGRPPKSPMSARATTSTRHPIEHEQLARQRGHDHPPRQQHDPRDVHVTVEITCPTRGTGRGIERGHPAELVDHHEIVRIDRGHETRLERRRHPDLPAGRTSGDVVLPDPRVVPAVAGRQERAPGIHPGTGGVQAHLLFPAHRTGREIEGAGHGCGFVPDRDRDRRRHVDPRRRPQLAFVVDLPPERAVGGGERTQGATPVARERVRAGQGDGVHLAVHRLLPSDLAVPAPQGHHASRAAHQHEVSGESRVRVLDTVERRLPSRGAVPVDGAHLAAIGRDDRAAWRRRSDRWARSRARSTRSGSTTAWWPAAPAGVGTASTAAATSAKTSIRDLMAFLPRSRRRRQRRRRVRCG